MTDGTQLIIGIVYSLTGQETQRIVRYEITKHVASSAVLTQLTKCAFSQLCGLVQAYCFASPHTSSYRSELPYDPNGTIPQR